MARSSSGSTLDSDEDRLRDMALKVIGYEQRHKTTIIPLERFAPKDLSDESDLPMVRLKSPTKINIIFLFVIISWDIMYYANLIVRSQLSPG